MKSQNFEFLRPARAVLADLAGFAESYAHSDPTGSLIKQRSFVEQAVLAIYDSYRLRPTLSDNLNDRMQDEAFKQAVPRMVLEMLHAVRIAGNHAAHPRRPILSQLALERLRDLFDIAKWVHVQLDRGARSDCPAYVPPVVGAATNGKAREALEKLRLAEARYEAVLSSLEEERKKRAAAEQIAQQSSAEIDRLKEEGQNVANLLEFDELTTRRRLIDQLLIDAGWKVGTAGANTDQLRQEEKLFTMPSPSGDGFADYVLLGDDGKPLAVIEAKRTSKDAKVGAEQARMYATCLEKATGQRPVIFFTNGIDIFIWDDVLGYPWRKVYGFYSKYSLEFLFHQRKHRKALATVAPNLQIADRMYQLEAVKRVSERFTDNFRRALIVQATGTGKTRVAISLCDVLMRAGWAKRILFLCDRRELRKQADRAFKEFMPGEPRVVVDSATSSDRDKRIYLATYPAMMNCYEQFDVGFFDLIIADESHRSVYKKFRVLFQHFDALQVGLTATPVGFIERNTYSLFNCEDKDPTSYFSFEDAVSATPPYLVPVRVRNFRSQIRERGLKYAQMDKQQQAEAEDQDEAAQTLALEPGELDGTYFNRDTTKFLWLALMTEGIRESTGSHVGKTIVFARSHDHAEHLATVFSELFPKYGSTFCRVIDHREEKAEQLIDDFKDKHGKLTIAISVDMLDTGIDIPEVVNLVFARPVKSFVKFWQMIGRGTRLCRDLFGPGRDKTEFLILDFWSNFWFFDRQYTEKAPSVQKSLLQKLFETRVALAAAAVTRQDLPVLDATVDLLVEDIRSAIDSDSIDVRDHRDELEQLADRDHIRQMSPAIKAALLAVAPLMQWRVIRGEEPAYRFDLLATMLELDLLKSGPLAPRVSDLRARVEDEVSLLARNQNPVKAKQDAIDRAESKQFWENVSVPALEQIRSELRGIMRYQQRPAAVRVAPIDFDITDRDFESTDYIPALGGLELVEYKRRVEQVLRERFAGNAVLQRVKAGTAVNEAELEELAKLVLEVDDRANVKVLVGRHPETRRSLLAVFRSIVGLDAAAVERAFTSFVHKHPQLTSQQLRFLQLLQNHIAQNGSIEIERLYEDPFTTVHAESVDGVFTDGEQVNEILAILETFQPRAAAPDEPPASKRAS
jgi:type I restriction enzyme, R subunit